MLEKFYRAVLPDEGHYALFLLDGRRHVWCPDIDALTRETEKRIDQQGIYFATGSFATPTQRTIENALYRRAFCFDIDAGPEKYAKHGDKVYKTKEDAVTALTTWIKTTGIKPSWLLSSGAGLHVYFVLDRQVPAAEWTPVAEAFKAMALFQGLKIDPAVTGDAARILRPPGTPHSSGALVAVLGNWPHTHTLDGMRAASAGFAPAVAPRRVSANDIFLKKEYNGPPRSADKLVKNCAAIGHVAAMRGDVEEPYWRAALGTLKHCENGEAAGHAISEGYPGYDYGETQKKIDLWATGPTLCTTFEGYNPTACAGCRFRSDRLKSPIFLAELNDEEVAARPKPVPPPVPEPVPAEELGEWTTTEADTAEAGLFVSEDDDTPAPTRKGPWEGWLPENFYILTTETGHQVMHNKAVQVEDETKDPRPDGTRPKKTIFVATQFAAVPFWIESWSAGEHDGDQALAVYCVFDKYRQRVQRYTLPTKNVASRETLLAALAAQNVQVFPSTQANKQSMEDYVKSSIERVRNNGQRQKILDRFGTMHTDKGELIIAQGKYLIAADGSVMEGVVSEQLKASAPAYRVPLPETATGTWTIRDWMSHALPLAKEHVAYLREFYADPNFVPYQLAIMLAWGSPFMAFMKGDFVPGSKLPGLGLSVSLYSTLSGIGKTACMQAAALAFGLPSSLVQQLDRRGSTDLARQQVVLQGGTMPSFLDEMEDLEAADLASLISMVGNGQGRIRIHGKTLQVTGGEKIALINLMSTNKSHRELAAVARGESNATQNRLLEIDCSRVLPVSEEVSRRESLARSRLQRCAGAVGAIIHASIVRLGSEKANQIGLDAAHDARLAIGGEQEGRIMWRALGAMIAVRRILRAVSPDLDVFDDKALITEFKRWHDAGTDFSAERIMPADGPTQMSMFMTDMAGNTLITRGEPDMRKKDARIEVPLNDRVPDDVHVRVVLDDFHAYVKIDALREWAAKRKISYRNLVHMCRDAGIIEQPYTRKDGKTDTRKEDLRKCTKLATGVRVPVYTVDMRRLNGMDYVKQSADVVPLLPSPGQTAEAPHTADRASG